MSVTLTEKLILVSIIMGAIIAMVTGILSSYTIPLLPGRIWYSGKQCTSM